MTAPQPWWAAHQPPDRVLIELGQLTWSATNLENDVHGICRTVGAAHGPWDDCPVSTHARCGLNALAKRPESELRTRAETWLEEAIGALADRNAVVHSTPSYGPILVVERGDGSFELADEQPSLNRQVLWYVPNKTGREAGKTSSETEFSAEAIRAVRRRSDALGAASLELTSELFALEWWR